MSIEDGCQVSKRVYEDLTVSPASVELGEMFTTKETKLFPDKVGCNNRVNLLNKEKGKEGKETTQKQSTQNKTAAIRC